MIYCLKRALRELRGKGITEATVKSGTLVGRLLGLFRQEIMVAWIRVPSCHGLNVCIPRKFICWNPNAQCDGTSRRQGHCARWLGHECRALMNGISAAIKETPGTALTPSMMWGHSEKALAVNQKKACTRTQSCYALILDFTASRTVKGWGL